MEFHQERAQARVQARYGQAPVQQSFMKKREDAVVGHRTQLRRHKVESKRQERLAALEHQRQPLRLLYSNVRSMSGKEKYKLMMDALARDTSINYFAAVETHLNRRLGNLQQWKIS